MVSLPLLQYVLYVTKWNSRAISTVLQSEMHTNHISTAWDAHEPFFSLAIEGRLTLHDLPGLQAFAELKTLKSSRRMNSINMLILKGWVIFVEVACTICLIFYAKRPWESMQIYKMNSTVKTICIGLLLQLLFTAPNITHGFVQRVWPLQSKVKCAGHYSCKTLFSGSPQGPWGRACTMNCGFDAFNYHKPQRRCSPHALLSTVRETSHWDLFE